MSYVSSKSDLISVRVTHEEKLQVKQAAKENNQTLTDYVRTTLLSNNVKQASKARHTHENKELSALLSQLDTKDKELSEKNKQIDNLHKLLNQQQQLTLSNNKLTSDISKQLETEQKKNKNKWYQFWGK